MKSNKLSIDYEYDFSLIGIVSPSKEYTLAWHLNNALNINFRKNDDIEFNFKSDGKMLISNFLFESDYSTFRLLKNKAVEFINVKNVMLLPELKMYDYLLKLTGSVEMDDISRKIRTVQVIVHNQLIDPYTLKSKDNLIFE